MSILLEVLGERLHRVGEDDERFIAGVEHSSRLIMVEQRLEGIEKPVHVQDEKLSSVMAEFDENVRFDQFVQGADAAGKPSTFN